MINKKRKLIQKKIIKKLSKFVKKGDIINCEFDLTKFNSILAISKNKFHFINFFLEIFYNLIGPKGTLIVPAFTYSWGKDKKKKIFDIKKSLPKVGILPSYLISLPNVSRTMDPMFSFAILGKNRKYFSDISNNSFGKNSVYEKILKKKGKLISFGLNQFDPTFVHFVEQYYDENFSKLKYRYLKKFSGILIDKKKKKKKKSFFCFVRKSKNNMVFNGKKIQVNLTKKNKLNRINILNNDIYIVNSSDFFREGLVGLKKSKYFFVKN